MNKRTVFALCIATMLVAGCSGTSTGISEDSTPPTSVAPADSTTPGSTDPATTPPNALDLSAKGAKTRKLPLPTDFTYVLPTASDLAESPAFFTGVGNFTDPVSAPIPAGSTALPWATGTLGGIEHTYRFDAAVTPVYGLHQVTMTIKALVFATPAEATAAFNARQEMLGKAANPAPYSFAPASLQIRYKTQNPTSGVSAITSLRGPVLIEAALEDIDPNINWLGEVSSVMELTIDALVAQHAGLAY